MCPCFKLLCYASLWGNRVDLSYNVSQHIAPAANLDDERAHLLVDDTQRVWDYLAAKLGRRVAMITDNAGHELLMDLALVDFMLATGLANQVVLHVKPQLPDELRSTLADMHLVILKGDANYRRLLGDVQWNPVTPFAEIVAYFPTPLMALRTLKAELIAGLQHGDAERLFAIEPDWRTNGRRGVAQARV